MADGSHAANNLDLEDGPDPIDVAVGHRIRIRRKWLNVSQSTLADHLGISFQQVQKYERGTNRVSASMLVRIAQKLETRVGDLVGETGENTTVSTDMLKAMAEPGAEKVLRLYARLSSKLRTTVLGLMRGLLGDEDEDDETEL